MIRLKIIGEIYYGCLQVFEKLLYIRSNIYIYIYDDDDNKMYYHLSYI